MRKFTFLLAISLGFSLTGLRAQHILDYIGTEYPGADTTFFFEEAVTDDPLIVRVGFDQIRYVHLKALAKFQ